MGFESAHLIRVWVLRAALAAAVLGALPSSASAAPTPTPTPRVQPSPTQAKGRAAPTAVLPSATPVPPSAAP
ncbi:MAG: hypothetical protein E6I52_25030, partial [Chloroflexi bacterium]